jgi:Asp-tRNA(Asn)/Glu-tRNA(Gln) amidotransferase A subunit family amidase
LLSGSLTSSDLVAAAYENIDKSKHLNCFVSLRNKENSILEAAAAQKRIDANSALSTLDGIPFAVKVSKLINMLGQHSCSRPTVVSCFFDIER